MCKVKSGVQLKNKEDVQNLVIGIIFRQQTKYTMKDICATVQYFLQDTQIEISQKNVVRIVEDNLDLLNRRGKIYCRNGCYTPQNIMYN
jgi:hypothetical protein